MRNEIRAEMKIEQLQKQINEQNAGLGEIFHISEGEAIFFICSEEEFNKSSISESDPKIVFLPGYTQNHHITHILGNLRNQCSYKGAEKGTPTKRRKTSFGVSGIG